MEKRLAGMPLSEKTELLFKMMRDNTKALEENSKKLEELEKSVEKLARRSR